MVFFVGIFNLLDEGVLIGDSEEDNVEVCSWGMFVVLDFEFKDYVVLGEGLKGFDFEIVSCFVYLCFVVMCGLIVCLYWVFV